MSHIQKKLLELMHSVSQLYAMNITSSTFGGGEKGDT